MKRLYFLAISLSVMAFSSVAASCGASKGVMSSPQSTTVVRYTSTTDPVLSVVVDSVEYRQDLTRLYGKLVGMPHTSGRIDAASLLSGKTAMPAADIDGVDFNRYFQWEDDGLIPIEIDFRASSPLNAAQLILTTTRGESVTNMKRR